MATGLVNTTDIDKDINPIPRSSYARTRDTYSNGYPLTLQNLPLVTHIVQQYRGREVDYPTLVSDAKFGFIEAERDFDPSKGEFPDHAASHARKNINRISIWGQYKVKGPIPYHVVSRRGRIHISEVTLSHELARTPTSEEVAAYFNTTYYPDEPKKHIKPHHVIALRNAKRRRNLETKFDAEEREKRTQTSMERYQTETNAIETRDSIRRMNELRANGVLDPQEKDILRMRFGLDGYEPMTLREVGEHYGLTRERIRQIEVIAIKKLKEEMCPEEE